MTLRALVLLLVLASTAWTWQPPATGKPSVAAPLTGAYYTGTVRTATGCTAANVNTQIAASSSLDIVRCTASSAATWSTQVAIPSTKGILLDLNGSTITCGSGICGADNSPLIDLDTNASTSTRITNGTIQYSGAESAGDNELFLGITTSEGSTDAPFRIDHITFDGDGMGRHIVVGGRGYGLFDHLTLLWSGNNEVIQHVAYSNGDTTGWAQTIDASSGLAEALYVEDSTFTNSQSGGYLGGKTLATYGARVVYRFNTINCMALDIHGNVHPTGRWFEFYRNAFAVVAPCNNVSDWVILRGGTGLVFQNTATGANSGGGNITSYEDNDDGNTGAWLQLYQVGSGLNGTTVQPAYMFSNTGSPGFNYSFPTDEDTVVQRGRDGLIDLDGDVTVGTSRPGTCAQYDLYWETDEGEWWAANGGTDGRAYRCGASNDWTLYYTPYIYPHPLQTSRGAGS